MSRRMRVGRSRHVCAYESIFNKAYAAARKHYTGLLEDRYGFKVPRKRKKQDKKSSRAVYGGELIDLIPIIPGQQEFSGFRDIDEAINIWIRKNDEA